MQDIKEFFKRPLILPSNQSLESPSETSMFTGLLEHPFKSFEQITQSFQESSEFGSDFEISQEFFKVALESSEIQNNTLKAITLNRR